MRDETFFDSETHYKSIETYSGKVVSLVISSVAKDLRIMVVNSSGKLESGFPFVVTIQGVGEYTDTDRTVLSISTACVPGSTAFP